MEAIRKLHNHKPEATWLLLNSIAVLPDIIEPPKPIFPKLKFSEVAMKRNVYSDNVNKTINGKKDKICEFYVKYQDKKEIITQTI